MMPDHIDDLVNPEESETEVPSPNFHVYKIDIAWIAVDSIKSYRSISAGYPALLTLKSGNFPMILTVCAFCFRTSAGLVGNG